jgi:hypothetical protein
MDLATDFTRALNTPLGTAYDDDELLAELDQATAEPQPLEEELPLPPSHPLTRAPQEEEPTAKSLLNAWAV